ncbi:zinc knuckle [Ostertagia ostertagi]
MSRATGPTTRSQTRASTSHFTEEMSTQEVGDPPLTPPKFMEELRATLVDLGDTDTVLGRDAKELRDATTSVVTEAWRDAPLSAQVGRMSLSPRQHAANRPTSRRRRYDQSFSQSAKGDRRRATNYSGGSRSLDGKCFNCGGFGHRSRECPSPRKETRNTVRPLTPQQPRSSSQPHMMAFQGTSPKVDPTESGLGAPPSQSLGHVDPQLQQLRIDALIKRNHKLSQRVFQGQHPGHGFSSSTASSSSPSVSCLFLTVCALSLLGMSNATSAWLCPSDSHDQIIRIPFSYNCSNIMPSTNATVDSLSLNIFRPNTRRYSTPAHWCKIVTNSAIFPVNFFRIPFH